MQNMLRKLLTLAALIGALASLAAMILVNISGTTSKSFIDNIYFSELENNYRWTMYGLCEKNDNNVYLCTVPEPAYPYSPVDNFSFTNIPSEFSVNRSIYYFLLRTAYGFFLVALLFSALSLMLVILPGCCVGTRAGSPTTTVLFMAFFFATVASTLITIAHVKGVHAFLSAGFSAALGREMFICMWVGVVLLLATFVILALRNRVEQRQLLNPKIIV